MAEEKALALWYAYNSALLHEYKKRAFPILCFDEDEVEFHQKLEKVVLTLALPAVKDEQKFYDDSLKTSKTTMPIGNSGAIHALLYHFAAKTACWPMSL